MPGETDNSSSRFSGPLGLRAFSEAEARERRVAARLAENPTARVGYGLVVRTDDVEERRGLVLELVLRRLVGILRERDVAGLDFGPGRIGPDGVHLVLVPREPSRGEILEAISGLERAGLEIFPTPAGLYVRPNRPRERGRPLEVLAFRAASRLRRLGAFDCPIRTVGFLDWEAEPPGRHAEALRCRLEFPFAEGSRLSSCFPVALYAGASEELEAAATREFSNILWGLDWFSQGRAFLPSQKRKASE